MPLGGIAWAELGAGHVPVAGLQFATKLNAVAAVTAGDVIPCAHEFGAVVVLAGVE